MDLRDPKNLSKLAAACRKAGIKSFKCGDVEFTLTEEAPESNYKKRQAKQTTKASKDQPIDESPLTFEQLLAWNDPDVPQNNEDVQ